METPGWEAATRAARTVEPSGRRGSAHRLPGGRLLGIAVALAIGTLLTSLPAPPAALADVRVVIENFSFQPPTITVSPGATVTWQMGNDPEQHTVTFADGTFDSGALVTGQLVSRTFPQTGTYKYFCRFHPFMQGTVVVTAGSSPVATATPLASPTESPTESPSSTAPPRTTARPSSTPTAPRTRAPSATPARATASPTEPGSGAGASQVPAGESGPPASPSIAPAPSSTPTPTPAQLPPSPPGGSPRPGETTSSLNLDAPVIVLVAVVLVGVLGALLALVGRAGLRR
jgi:plastocyanin